VCTLDTCNTKTGECVFTDNSHALTCSQTNKCFTYKCDPIKGVVSTPLTCTSTDKCLNAFCDSARGCVFTNVTCSSPLPCGTSYKCNSATGQCETIQPVCNDNNACTNDRFQAGIGCVFAPKCVSADLCTVASCSTAGACSFKPKNCDDGNPCTVDSCDFATGKCTNTPKICSCPAGNAASCNPTTGFCEYRPRCTKNSDCAGTNPCCDPVRGCLNITPTRV